MPNYTTYNIKMVKGDTESFGFEVTGIDSLDTAFFSCKRNSQDANYLFQKSLGAGITQSAESRYIVRIAPEDTQSLAPGQYWYDLEIGKDGDIFTILRGVLELVPEITEPNAVVYTSVDWGNIVGNIQNQSDLQAALNAKATTSSLAQVATTGSYDDLTDTPTIPTKTSELTNDSDFVVESSLAAVATSGSYVDLSNKPSILEEYVLYVPSTTFVTSNFTLNDSIMNYKKIGIIYCQTNEVKRIGYTEFFVDSSLSSSSHDVFISITALNSADSYRLYTGYLSFSGNTVAFLGVGNCRLTTSGITFDSAGCGVKKVIGFK